MVVAARRFGCSADWGPLLVLVGGPVSVPTRNRPVLSSFAHFAHIGCLHCTPGRYQPLRASPLHAFPSSVHWRPPSLRCRHCGSCLCLAVWISTHSAYSSSAARIGLSGALASRAHSAQRVLLLSPPGLHASWAALFGMSPRCRCFGSSSCVLVPVLSRDGDGAAWAEFSAYSCGRLGRVAVGLIGGFCTLGGMDGAASVVPYAELLLPPSVLRRQVRRSSAAREGAAFWALGFGCRRVPCILITSGPFRVKCAALGWCGGLARVRGSGHFGPLVSGLFVRWWQPPSLGPVPDFGRISAVLLVAVMAVVPAVKVHALGLWHACWGPTFGIIGIPPPALVASCVPRVSGAGSRCQGARAHGLEPRGGLRDSRSSSASFGILGIWAFWKVDVLGFWPEFGDLGPSMEEDLILGQAGIELKPISTC